MNHFKFKELEIGHEESFVFELDETKMKQFLMITNDINPLHNDLEFAKEKGYSEKVVYGLLTASALSTLAGVYLPGEKSLIHSVEINFVKPVFLSKCPLTIIGKVLEKDDRFSRIVVKFIIKDNSGEKVSRGIMKIGFLE